jgi:hypothetical protein
MGRSEIHGELTRHMALLTAGGDVRDGLHRLVGHCAARAACPAWEDVLEFDTAAEADAFDEWLRDILAESPLPEEINILWLSNIFLAEADDEGVGRLVLDIGGYAGFDEKDDELKWLDAPGYYGEEPWRSPFLQMLNELAWTYEGDISDMMEHYLAVGFVSLCAARFARRVPEVFAREAGAPCHLLVGPEDGDNLLLGAVAGDRWVPRTDSWSTDMM